MSESQIERLEVLKDEGKVTVVALKFRKRKDYLLCIANDSADKTAVHSVTINGQIINWTGAFLWKKFIN